MNRTILHKMDVGTTKIEKKIDEQKQKAKRLVRKASKSFWNKFVLIILALATVIYLITKFNNWSVKHEIIWQSPIILRVPVYIKEVKPVIKIKTVEVTPAPKKTEKEIIDGTKHAEVLWKIYGLESTWGKNDGCRTNGEGFAGFGVMYEGKVICYPTFEKAVERAEHWLVQLGVDKDLASALCTWNTGVKQPNCKYYQSYLSL